MHVGVPAEVKDHEGRVALTPAGALDLVRAGHTVTVQRGAGLGSGLPDDAYTAVGAQLGSVDDAWGAELVLKVKEPVEAEHGRLRPDLTLFTYLHLAADRPLVDALLAARTTAVAYETVQLADGSLPLLAPMSEVAGRMSVVVGAYHLLGAQGGSGTLLGGVPGVRPANVAVLGGGTAGLEAVRQAVALGARTTVLDLSLPRLREVDAMFQGRVATVASSAYEVERTLLDADLVVGAVLVPGARAPRLVTHDLVARMRPGSVLVDIAIDQGGCFEDSHPTTHAGPTFRVEGSVFYCVANMPGAAASTATPALTNATLPYVKALADHGWRAATAADPALAKGLSTVGGEVVQPAVAAALGRRDATTVPV